ncbi:MAG: plasmid pRiA4b ORF-3 family protein [Tannerellaceae bacterium]|jgi:hypothetical protein|nr:plasmid pRiA4b ORF-3 family protein [Tannerellaceae bacterium]
MTFQFKIQLKGISKPPVWRTISIPADFTFLRFHTAIQVAFGWENDHLFEFSDNRSTIRISVPVKDDFSALGFSALSFTARAQAKNASKTRLSDIFTDKISKLLYVYDFGDNWVHEITLKSVVDTTTSQAVCLSCKGACPPEDCGGIYGYEAIKETFATMPESAKAEEYREWLGLEDGETWDAHDFNIDEVNTYLKQV